MVDRMIDGVEKGVREARREWRGLGQGWGRGRECVGCVWRGWMNECDADLGNEEIEIEFGFPHLLPLQMYITLMYDIVAT